MQLILQTANVTADAKNCSYPNKVTVTNASELQEAVKMDHVCAKYKNNYRSIDNFLKSNVVVMDLDNDHTDDPDEWITAEKLEELLPDISYAVAPSRNHIYSDDGDVNIFHERKLDALEDLIEAANGKPVLVAYWFKHDLRRISERLSNLGIDYQQLDSDASIKKWNAGQLQVGLIHPASAGHGLNLQSGGNILVWFGITWSLELYQQTVARLWRQGQTEGTVSVIHIVTDGTVDERILKALEAKDLTQSALIDAVKAEVGDGK